MHNVHSARAMHVHYATHHEMQCTTELRTLSFISVPNLVSLAQNFLEPEESFYPRKTTDVDIVSRG